MKKEPITSIGRNADISLTPDQRIDVERVHLLSKQAPLAITASVVNALVLVYLVHNQVASQNLIIWLGAILVISAVRLLLIYQYRRKGMESATPRLWILRHIVTLSISGLVWGSSAFLLFAADSIPHQFFLAVVMCGLVAGATMAFSVIMQTFTAFSIPAMLPLSIRLVGAADELQNIMGLLAALFLLLSFFIANNISKTRLQLLRLKDNFAQRVAERTQELAYANARLKAENEERVQAEKYLRLERDRLETITANIGASLAIISKDYRTLWTNAVFQEVFGPANDDKPCYATYYQKEGVCDNCAVRKVLEEGAEKAILEKEDGDQDGNPTWFQFIATPIRDEKGQVTAALNMVLPITERKLAQQERERMITQLEEARRGEAITTLAGGMAHQFNNALSVITGSIELLQYDYSGDTRMETYLKPMLQTARQMSRLTDQLLAYAKEGKYKPRLIPMAEFMQATLPIVSHDIKPEITVTTGIDPELPSVQIDITQMQMVISAILANASEAIENKGTLGITCRQKTVRADEAGRLNQLQAGEYVCIRIVDDGAGMDDGTRKRIFEPFFSTKFQGRGLGMAAVHGIIQNHGGYIDVASTPGRGTQVSIYLPKATDAAAPITGRADQTFKGSGTVLLIEDEEMVMAVNRAILERLGYSVVEARDGREALELIGQSPTEFNLVLLDIKLPDMGGGSIYPHIRKHRPGTKVIICSGYALDGPTQALMDAGADGYVHKPFTLSSMAEKLNQVLKTADGRKT